MTDLTECIEKLLERVPDSQRQVASELLAQYGPRLFELAQEDAWQWLRRLLAGDLDVVTELDSKLSDDQFVAKVKTNTARWENVAGYNQVRDELRNEILLRLAPVVLNLLAGLVGL
ncbi:MAG TPA: hypothetical protein PK082_00470 [Phycisphaerae bacterium]|nr:hypothetical protein [Phycisphaerae bacterium]